jgi:hypothetical protein
LATSKYVMGIGMIIIVVLAFVVGARASIVRKRASMRNRYILKRILLAVEG